ncbi:MAG: hypothetical protein U1E02_43005 [Hydrogenophaga sp.]|nr:hypothetical protein [Hydrogenophaga sp.]
MEPPPFCRRPALFDRGRGKMIGMFRIPVIFRKPEMSSNQEEAMGSATIKSKVTLDDPKDKKTKVTFEYAETKSGNKGAGPRGLKIWEKGKGGTKEYDIEPNPHDNLKYIKTPAKLYAELAEAVGNAVLADKSRDAAAKKTTWPGSVKVKWGGEDYSLKS